METTDLVIVASAVVAGTSLLKDLKNGTPHAGPIVFGFLLATALLAIAIPAPKFARGLSYLALVGAFAVNGPTVLGLAAGFGPHTPTIGQKLNQTAAGSVAPGNVVSATAPGSMARAPT